MVELFFLGRFFFAFLAILVVVLYIVSATYGVVLHIQDLFNLG